MKYSNCIIIIAIILAAIVEDHKLQAIKLVEGIAMLDFNGADEDEIMDKVFSKYASEGKDHNGQRNG